MDSLRDVNGQVIIMDLGLSSHLLGRHLDGYPGGGITIKTDIESFTQLLRCLVDILEYKLDSMDLPLKLLIIDNLSVFHWDLLCDDTIEEEYTSLVKILQRIRNEFGTAIVTTSLGVEFESGMTLNYRHHRENKPVYCQWSCIPQGFLQQTHDIVHIADGNRLHWRNTNL